MAGADDEISSQHVQKPVPNAYTINIHYVALASDAGIIIQPLLDKLPAFCLPYCSGRSPFHPALAFAPTRHNLLAAANASRVSIFNLAKKKARCILKGNGRIVTSIAFSDREHHIVATGGVDGSICIWSVKQPSRPLCQLVGIPGACCHVAIHSIRAGVFASLHGDKLAIWSLADSRLLAVTSVTYSQYVHLAWHSEESVVGITSNGYIIQATFGQLQRPLKTWKTAGGNQDSGDELDSSLRSQDQNSSTVTSLHLPSSLRHIQQATILGTKGVVVLPVEREVIYFYSYSLSETICTELWRLHIDLLIDCFALRHVSSGIEVVVFANGNSQSHSVPATVLDAMHRSSNNARMPAGNTSTSGKGLASGRMIPDKTQRRTATVRLSSDKVMLASPKIGESQRKRLGSTHPLDPALSASNAARSMAAGREPIRGNCNGDATESPMPIPSPFIPAQKEHQGLITPLGDDLSLLPASFSSLTSTATHGHDSDSDDETFAGNLRHSTSFLPGGVNVPLPRTCGATFAPNGNLLTFFPYQLRPGTAPVETPMATESHSKEERSLEAASLFPRFGNFVSSHAGSDPSGSLDETLPRKPKLFNGETTFFQYRSSWSAKGSPVKATNRLFPTASKVRVSVRSIEALTPTRKVLALTYSICAEEPESAADLSRSNARAAASVRMYDASEAWRLLAIIMEQRFMMGTRNNRMDSQQSVLHRKQRPPSSQNKSLAIECRDLTIKSAAILQSSHPFGKAWAIDQLFASLEQQADVQLLACMSALLVKALERRDNVRNSSQDRISPNKHFDETQTAERDVMVLPPGVPIVRTNSSALTMSEGPPAQHKTSETSSRNTSQPSTPYLDSFAGTPPLTLPSLVRHGTGVFHSSSTSPEHHRSSFSIAAKSYAASIAEKFSSYGSSPPAKRNGTGSKNELSSSLPNASATGSWSKSVSFASTLGTGEPSNRSLSLAKEDDNYDSDRTIDDSLPHTAKKPTAQVLFKLKNESQFKRVSTQNTCKLMTDFFLIKSALWRRHYAEQLRSWGLLQEAAEVEAVTSVRQRSVRPGSPPSAVVFESTGPTSRATCIICYCVIHTAKQLCPACFHTSHPDCLGQFICTLGDACFTCPSGCGCDCTKATSLPFDTV